MCARWGGQAKASESEGKGGKAEVWGGEYLLCLCVMRVWLWLEGRGIPYFNYPLYALSVQNIITVSAPVHGIIARTSAFRD